MRRFFAAAVLVLAASAAAGADDRNTITVRGKGTVRVRPDRLVLVLGAKGDAEKASDAVEKLNKKKDEIRNAIDAALKNNQGLNASVKDSGISFGSPVDEMAAVRMMGGQQNESAGNISVSTQLEVSVSGVDKMTDSDLASLISSLLDKATDAGAETKTAANRFNIYLPTGNSGLGVFFAFSDYEAQVEKAWDEAAKKARERAEAISKRLGMTAGDAVRVKDVSNEGSGAPAKGSNPYAAMLGMAADEGGPKIKSSGEMELSVEMEVEFELKKK